LTKSGTGPAPTWHRSGTDVAPIRMAAGEGRHAPSPYHRGMKGAGRALKPAVRRPKDGGRSSERPDHTR